MRSALTIGALRSLLPAAIALFFLLGVIPHLGLYRTATPLSGSMEPTFSAGDLLVLRPEPLSRIRVGQMITYSIPIGDHHVETHRVIRVLRGGSNPIVQTKGDANSVADPWTAVLHGGPVWKVDRVLPGLGSPILFLEQRWLRLAFVFGVSGLLLLYGIARIWAPAPTPKPVPVTVLAAGRELKDDAAVAA
ncbi:MAG TPA: signal peptidase I [Gaiellaceae bacterium]|nr:signal peptidase I [Gaiellaceae bacterium]